MSHKFSRTFASLVLALAIAFAGVTPAYAAAPANDDFDNAAVISGLPYSDTIDTSEATGAEDDPTTCHWSRTPSVWYSFTPATDMIIRAETIDISYDTVLSAYTGSPGVFTQIGCNDNAAPWGGGSRLEFAATAGTTYYFLIQSNYEYGGNLTFSVQELMPPANDDFDNATVIPGLPYSDTIDTSEATKAFDDWVYEGGFTVWYSFTPAGDIAIEANTFGSNYDTIIAIFTGSRDDLNMIAYRDGYLPDLQESISLSLSAGVTYYFSIASYTWTAGNLTFSVQELMPPANDDFDFATVIPGLPFSNTVNAFQATTAPDDPTSCFDDYYETGSTVWYSLIPTVDMVIEANTIGSDYFTTLSVYTGIRGALDQIACNKDNYDFNTRVRFYAKADTTYYFMVARKLGWIGATLEFSVQEYVPQQLPVAEFWFDPWDPYASENITFCDSSYDPEEVGLITFAWDFGDGTSSIDSCTEHQYMADGDYTVDLTVTTPDGRTASTSQVVHVSTHDIAITKLLAPVAAKAGQIRPITVSVKSLIYDETVSVDLYKRGPDGDEWIGYSSQFVPIRSGNRTTAFTFKYTFTDSDAIAGEVTFYAVANIQEKRDAFPENNEATASTKVRR